MRLAILALAVALAAAPAAAGASAPEADSPTQATSGKAEKPKRVCRELETTVGSRFGGGGRVCRTAEQWAKIDKAGATAVSNFVEKTEKEVN